LRASFLVSSLLFNTIRRQSSAYFVEKLEKWRAVFLQKAKAFSIQHNNWYLSLPVALPEEIVRFLSPSVYKILEIVKSEIISSTRKISSFSTE